jgi:hypothetical protein
MSLCHVNPPPPQKSAQSTGSKTYSRQNRHNTADNYNTNVVNICHKRRQWSVIQGGQFPAWPRSVCLTLRRRCCVCRVLGVVRVGEGYYRKYRSDKYHCYSRCESVAVLTECIQYTMLYTLLLTLWSSCQEIAKFSRRMLCLSASVCVLELP